MVDCFSTWFPLWEKTLNWIPSEEQQLAFYKFYQWIITVNRSINLTRLTDPQDFWEKHLWDSLAGVLLPMGEGKQFDFRKCAYKDRILDIGTGGGFPGIPLAILSPQSFVTLIDSTQKKIKALQEIVTDMELSYVTPLWSRAEELALEKDHRQQYDLVVLRAVTRVDRCALYALPFLKKGGVAILYRGQWTPEEEQELKTVLKANKGELLDIIAFTTPLTNSIRHSVMITR